MHVISLRLAPPIFRLDLWSPSCWRDQTARRQLHREQLQSLLAALPSRDGPWIAGGDFNAPAGDAIFLLLSPWLTDAHHTAGVGWGDTVTATMPFLRIDQLWLSPDLRPARLRGRNPA